MATDGPDPTPCDDEIYRTGSVVFQTYGVSSNRMESWVKNIARDSGQRVDWLFVAGCAVVKAIGDLAAVHKSIESNMPELAELQRATSARSDRATEQK